MNLVHLFLKVPRTTEVTPEAAKNFLATMTQISGVSGIQKMMGQKPQILSLEIVVFKQQIRFMVTCDETLATYVESQIQSNYPLVIIERIEDPLIGQSLNILPLTLKKGNYYPINVMEQFQDTDPISSLLSVMSKSEDGQIAMVQYALSAAPSSWQSHGQRLAETGGGKNAEGTAYLKHPDESIIKEKVSYPGFYVSPRLIASSKKTLTELMSTYGVFNRADGNTLVPQKPSLLAPKTRKEDVLTRTVKNPSVLNIAELATMWHLPNDKIKTASIAWGNTVLSEPPDNLPIAGNMSEEEKLNVNFFAKTTYKNKEAIFGLKTVDRRRHTWIVGKTGTGKSTLIANMGIDDVKKDRGMGIIDPHGDLCETILDYIPAHRINDTIYFNPADKEFPIVINPLEVTNREEAELVVSGIVSIFNKIFGFSWGPRLEYILRNTLLTLASIPDSTLEHVLHALTNQSFRTKMIDKCQDPVIKNFWINEFNKMQDRQREEAVAPILNKVGQFVTSPLIRRIIGQPKSSILLDEVMNDGKIMLANLSQGRLGEDNAALLGAMLITKFQLAAMRRVEIPEDQRRDFFLYVDEFQNFATPSFMKILSEARKYRLALTLANQYMAQIPEEVQKSILGNAGTLVAFGVGADDAAIIHKEFSEVFSENDLVNLANRQVATKLMVDGHASRPFIAHTLPLPASKNENREKIIRISRERWAKPIPAIETKSFEEVDQKPFGSPETNHPSRQAAPNASYTKKPHIPAKPRPFVPAKSVHSHSQHSGNQQSAGSPNPPTNVSTTPTPTQTTLHQKDSH